MLPVVLVSTLFTLGSDYRSAYQQFLLATNQFRQYKTESTRFTAVSATRQVLAARNTLWKTYLQDLRFQLAADTNIANYSQTTAYLNLESELSHLNTLNYLNISSLSQAAVASKNWESRLNKSESLVASARTQILAHRLDQFAARLQAIADTASPSSTLDLARQKLSTSTSDLKARHQLLLSAANLLLQLP